MPFVSLGLFVITSYSIHYTKLYDSFADKGDFFTALEAMKAAAEAGKDSTVDMVAKLGRASRLGERSRGVLDAGATSCWLILGAMADAVMGAGQ